MFLSAILGHFNGEKPWGKTHNFYWLVVTGTWLDYDFPSSWEFHHPNWLSLIFFRGVETTNQLWYDHISYISKLWLPRNVLGQRSWTTNQISINSPCFSHFSGGKLAQVYHIGSSGSTVRRKVAQQRPSGPGIYQWNWGWGGQATGEIQLDTMNKRCWM